MIRTMQNCRLTLPDVNVNSAPLAESAIGTEKAPLSVTGTCCLSRRIRRVPFDLIAELGADWFREGETGGRAIVARRYDMSINVATEELKHPAPAFHGGITSHSTARRPPSRRSASAAA